MTNQIKVLRENVIKTLSQIKDDNVSIAGVAIKRHKLLEALKLQTQDDADLLTITYGNVSWENVKPEPCIQFSCNHTTMRFMNRPALWRNGTALKVIPLDFVDHHQYAKPKPSGTRIDTESLLKAISFVQHGMESENIREALNCMLFDCGGDTLNLATADGHRLVLAKFNVKGIFTDKLLIHRSDIPKLLTFLKSNTEGKGKNKSWFDTYISLTDKTIKFMSERGMVEFDKHDYKFPEYSKLIPKGGTKIECNAGELLRATIALSKIAKDGSGIIRLFFKQAGKITLMAKSEEIGESSVDCDAIVEADCKTALDSKFLIDLLKQCEDTKIALKVKTQSDPILFNISDTKQSIIMPIFVQWDD